MELKMIRSFADKNPQIEDSAYVDDSAVVIGDVTMDEKSSMWPGAVARADGGAIRIGKRTSIQDNVVIHVDPGYMVRIGNGCIIGHGAVIHCESIGDRVLIGINSTLLEGSRIGEESIIAANSVVGGGMEVPKRSFVAGIPGEIKKEVTDAQVESIKLGSSFYASLCGEYRLSGSGI